MDRKIRSQEDLAAIRVKFPLILEVYDRLLDLTGLEVTADGERTCVFKVYLKGRTEQYQGFLWMHEELANSYVCWEHQGELKEKCRTIWSGHVKDHKNSNGSYLTDAADVETIVRLVKKYLALTTPIEPATS